HPARGSASWPRWPMRPRGLRGSPTPGHLSRWRPRRRPATVPCSSFLLLRTGRLRGRRLVVGVLILARLGLALAGARVAAGGGVLRGPVAQRDPVGYQALLVDVVGGHRERLPLDVEGDRVAFDRGDPPRQPAASVLRQFQHDLGLFAKETLEL